MGWLRCIRNGVTQYTRHTRVNWVYPFTRHTRVNCVYPFTRHTRVNCVYPFTRHTRVNWVYPLVYWVVYCVSKRAATSTHSLHSVHKAHSRGWIGCILLCVEWCIAWVSARLDSLDTQCTNARLNLKIYCSSAQCTTHNLVDELGVSCGVLREEVRG